MTTQSGPRHQRSECLSVVSILFLAFVLLFLVPVSQVQAGMTLDQQHLVESGSVVFNDTQTMAQTFTSSITGQLAQVDILAGSDGGLPATISIQTVAADGIPSGTVLGSVDLSSWTTESWNEVDFQSESIWLTSGQQYAIVLSGNGGGEGYNSIAVNWASDAYSGGQNWVFWWSGAETWNSYATDIAFQTWMVVENVVPTPGSILLASIGVVVLSHLRRRRSL